MAMMVAKLPKQILIIEIFDPLKSKWRHSPLIDPTSYNLLSAGRLLSTLNNICQIKIRLVK
jgi:hypothetical protein